MEHSIEHSLGMISHAPLLNLKIYLHTFIISFMLGTVLGTKETVASKNMYRPHLL